ncbi:hypothetical protein [Methylobacterium oxalidis]|nr:hypothetical protein [Methylobacterium oxalidis]
MRSMGAGLCRCVGACAPNWEPRVPVFFITLIDEGQIVYPTDANTEGFRRSTPHFPDIHRTYRRALRGFDYIGMLDPALYVSTQKVECVSRFILWHAHALVWNTSAAALDQWASEARWSMRAYLPYASGIDWRPIRPPDLRQLIWYTGKTPRQQYQLWRREKGSLQQYARPINGVNAVRLYATMRNLTLPELTFAGGAGRQIIRRTLRRASAW